MNSEIRRITTRTKSTRDDWRTPAWVQELFQAYAKDHDLATWDPYPSPDSAFHFCDDQTPIALADSVTYNPDGTCAPQRAVWANPPYGRALLEHSALISRLMYRHALVVALVPARPGVRWWCQLAQRDRLVVVPHDRFHFDDGDDPAMFQSAMVIGGTDAHCAGWADVWRGEAWIARSLPSDLQGRL
jgi:hypothetical protein